MHLKGTHGPLTGHFGGWTVEGFELLSSVGREDSPAVLEFWAFIPHGDRTSCFLFLLRWRGGKIACGEKNQRKTTKQPVFSLFCFFFWGGGVYFPSKSGI